MSIRRYLLKVSLLRCGVLASTVGVLINAFFFKETHTWRYLGVEIFFSTLITSFIVSWIYYGFYDRKRSTSAPELSEKERSNWIYRCLVRDRKSWSLYISVLSLGFFGLIPAALFFLLAPRTPASMGLWLVIKIILSLGYVSFTVYHTVAYRLIQCAEESASREEVVSVGTLRIL